MRGDNEIRDPAARLDALWEATRPVEPSAQAWDQVWTSVADDLEQLSAPAVHSPAATRREGVLHVAPSRFARRSLVVASAAAAVALAQAAAIMLALGLSMRGADREPVVRIEEGQLVLIRSNAGEAPGQSQAAAANVQAIDLSAQLGAGGVDAWYLVYNRLESMTTSLVVASSE